MKILGLFILLFQVSCSNSITPSFKKSLTPDSAGTDQGANPLDPFGPPSTTTTTTTTTLASPPTTGGDPDPGGNGSASGCTGQAGDICLGGYGNDPTPKTLKANIIYAAPAGTSLVSNPQAHAQAFIDKVNTYYSFEGHQYLKLELNEVDEVVQESDSALIAKYAKAGYYTMILVQTIPGPTAGYVRHLSAEIEKAQAWTIFEFGLASSGVADHEGNHLFGFVHTSSQNGGNPNQFLSGYNYMKDILSASGAYKRPFDNDFKNYVDDLNRPDAKVELDGMLFDTHNLMYYSVLPDRPALFTQGSTGYHHSYSHLFHYYYNKFVKDHAE